MAGACPVPGPEDPLVRSLIAVVDCNVQGLVRDGYSALFEPSSPFAVLLTALMTLYVAFIGFGLLLGRAQLRISDLVLSVIKLAIVLALATQWATYQSLVYATLFRGPQQLATAMMHGGQSGEAAFDVFDRLQAAFDAMTESAKAYGGATPPSTSPMLGGVGSGAMLLTLSGGVLLLSSLGVLLASRVVVGLLLAVGPLFVALLLFDTTRGLFEGWLRAALAFAFAPLGITLLLGVALTMLEPSLVQLAELRARASYPLGPVYSVAILVTVFAGVALGLLIAGGMIARGFKLPARRAPAASGDLATAAAPAMVVTWMQPRAARVAAAAAAMERRESTVLAREGAVLSLPAPAGERRISSTATTKIERGSASGASAAAAEPRIAQQGSRRSTGPRSTRTDTRSLR